MSDSPTNTLVSNVFAAVDPTFRGDPEDWGISPSNTLQSQTSDTLPQQCPPTGE